MKEFAAAKQKPRCSEEADKVQEQSLVCRYEATFHRSEQVLQGEAYFAKAKEENKEAKAKDPSPQQRRSRKDKNTSIFSPIIGPFSKDINTLLVIDIEGDLEEEHFPILGFLYLGSDF